MGLKVKPNQARALFSLAFATTEEERRPKIGDWIDAKERRPLEVEKLIGLEKRGRATHAELTERGWTWVADNLAAPELFSNQRADRVLSRVLSRLQVYLDQHGDSLHTFLDVRAANDQQAVRKNEPLETRIRNVALELAHGQTRTRIRLRDVRKRLKDVSRAELDRALFSLQDQGGLVLYRIDDPNDVHSEDEHAALHVAGYPRHILYLER